MNRHNSSHIIAISQLSNSSPTSTGQFVQLREDSNGFNAGFMFFCFRHYELLYLQLQIDHGWGRLAMIAIMGMMVQDAFAAGLSE